MPPTRRMGANRFQTVYTGETNGVVFLSANPLLFLATQILGMVTWLGRCNLDPRGHPACGPWRFSFPGFCAVVCGLYAGLG